MQSAPTTVRCFVPIVCPVMCESEAVAVKKSLILTPAETAAECAHHGAPRGRCSYTQRLLAVKQQHTRSSPAAAQQPRTGSMPMGVHTPMLQLSPPLSLLALTGEEKSKFGLLKLVLLSIIAGCYVGFGYTICLHVGGNIGE